MSLPPPASAPGATPAYGRTLATEVGCHVARVTPSPDVLLLRHLARLVAALGATEPPPEERRAALRAITRAARGTGAVAHVRDGALYVDGEPVGGPPAVDVIGRQLAAHDVARLVIRQHAPARELAQFAGVLARGADARVVADVDALHLWHVQLDVAAAADAGAADALPAVVRAALAQLDTADDAAAVTRAYDALTAWIAGTVPSHPTAHPTARAGMLVARVLARAVALVLAHDAPDVTGRLGGLISLLVTLDLHPLVEAVASGTVPEAARVLQCITSVAVPLLIERLAAAESIGERRRCSDALAAVGGGFETLTHALGDSRWYVVRNVALVVGELRLEGAVRPLGRCLASPEPRVRDAAARALDQIDTPPAIRALLPALLDRSVEVRRLAARAVARAAHRDVAVPAATCIARLDAESDAEVAQDLLGALGAIGSADALRYLHAVVKGRTAWAHDDELRVCALRALADPAAPSGQAIARALLDDTDVTVRRMASDVLFAAVPAD